MSSDLINLNNKISEINISKDSIVSSETTSDIIFNHFTTKIFDYLSLLTEDKEIQISIEKRKEFIKNDTRSFGEQIDHIFKQWDTDIKNLKEWKQGLIILNETENIAIFGRIVEFFKFAEDKGYMGSYISVDENINMKDYKKMVIIALEQGYNVYYNLLNIILSENDNSL
jgi:hypothetical protein